MTSYKCDLQQASFLVWFPGQVPVGPGSEFYFCIWSEYWLLVYSLSHLAKGYEASQWQFQGLNQGPLFLNLIDFLQTPLK